MPVKFRLELVAVIGLHIFDAERELADYVIQEIDCIRLVVFAIGFQCSNTRRIVNSCVLKSLDPARLKKLSWLLRHGYKWKAPI
jgi:hypothetical protein